jgi:hypothetical protein
VEGLSTGVVLLATALLLWFLSETLPAVISWLLGRLFPRRGSPGQARFEDMIGEQIAEDHAEETEQIGNLENLATMAGLFITPFLLYQAMARISLLGAPEGAVFLYPGAVKTAIPQMIAGALLGAALVPVLIRLRWKGEVRAKLLWWWHRSEDRHGRIGRLVTTNAGRLATLILLVTFALFGNDYVVVSSSRLNAPSGRWGFARTIHRVGGGATLYVVAEPAEERRIEGVRLELPSDVVLTSDSDYGGWPILHSWSVKATWAAAAELEKAEGLTVDRITPAEAAAEQWWAEE